MNVLCIGNSFSQDATRYLHQISGDEIFVRNLYIGGCSLKMHHENILAENELYEYQKNGRKLKMTSINSALKKKKWDYITLQQVSQDSGIEETYQPYFDEIVKYIRENCPKAKIVIHRTWAYPQDSYHGGFVNYGRDRKTMYQAIVNATNSIAKQYGFDIIPCGDAVELASALPEFNGTGLKMHRDGFHLTLDYGRYLAGLVMYKYFTGKSTLEVEYEPEDTLPEVNKKLKEIANTVKPL